ncbi:hypothetical protein [Flavobacterium psychrophilum]|uniref:hypothetical protein n=1 Tax=Flavobacterium psychrophilum TaxID=96345 RepID=UPI002C80E1EE|nr:hypothetical protein [Flavobacterium psychrophilum]
MSIQKIEWEDKVNSPELLAAIQQFGKKHYLSAEQINELRDKINSLIIEGSTPKSDSLMYTSKRIFMYLNVINEWHTSTSDFFGSELVLGTSAAPSHWLNTLIFPIPTGYILEDVLVNMNYKMDNMIPSTLEFLIQREETTGTVQTNAGVNAITICNDTLSTDAGSLANNRVFKKLAVNTHLLPTLNFSYLRIAIRETQAVSYFGIILQLKFKKV